MKRRQTWIAWLALVCLVGVSGCNSNETARQVKGREGHDDSPSKKVVDAGDAASPSDVRGDAGAFSPAARWVQRRDRIVLPWVNVLKDKQDGPTVDVEEGRLVVPPDQARTSRWERGDIVASVRKEAPFLRKLIRKETKEGRVLWKTERASITDAVYKASWSTADLSSNSRQTKQGLIRQPATSGYKQMDEPGSSFAARALCGQNKTCRTAVQVFDVEATPYIDLNPKLHFSGEIEPPQTCTTGIGCDPKTPSSGWVYEGTRTCDTSNDCFGLETCRGGECVYDASGRPGEQLSCHDLVAAMEAAEGDNSCRRQWNAWWNSNGRSGSRTCTDAAALAHLSSPFLEAPYPAQIDWAKAHCAGGLKRFEADIQATFEAGFRDVGFSLKPGPEIEETLFRKAAPQYVTFWIGPLPVLLTFEPSISGKFTAEANDRLGVELADEIGVKPVTFGAGIHYYDDKAHRGRFYQPGESYGEWHANGHATPQFQFESVSVGPEFQAGVGFEASLKLVPRFDLRLYDALGPFVEPATISTTIDAGLGTETTCSLGTRIGLSGYVGVGAKFPICPPDVCGSKDIDIKLYDTCEPNYCQQSTSLCWRDCLTGGCQVDCNNGQIDSHETGKDCGGPTCEPCPVGKSCQKDRDCQTNHCASGTCRPQPTCSDGIQNGSETGTDCGGPDCPPCQNECEGNSCNKSQCPSGTCDPGETPISCSQDCTCPGQEKNDPWDVVQIKGSPDLWVVEGQYAHYISDIASYRKLGKPTKHKMSQKVFNHCYTEKRSIDGEQPNGQSDRPLLSTPNTNDYFMYKNGEVRPFANRNAYMTCSRVQSFDVAFEHANRALLQSLGGVKDKLCDPSRSKVACSGKPGHKTCNSMCEWSACRTSCTDQCPNSSAKKCSGNASIATCGNHDGDSCLEWSKPKLCPGNQTCQNRSCGCHATNQKTCNNGDVYKVDSCGQATSLVQSCDDGNECTRDLCRNGNCQNPPKSKGTSCANGQGQCQNGQCSVCKPSNCDDGNECTRDTCRNGQCAFLDKSDGTLCSNGQGQCQNGQCSVCKPSNCDDGNECTRDTCRNGQCSHPPKPRGTSCNDGDACTTNDACDGNGQCTGQLKCQPGAKRCSGGNLEICKSNGCGWKQKNCCCSCTDGQCVSCTYTFRYLNKCDGTHWQNKGLCYPGSSAMIGCSKGKQCSNHRNSSIGNNCSPRMNGQSCYTQTCWEREFAIRFLDNKPSAGRLTSGNFFQVQHCYDNVLNGNRKSNRYVKPGDSYYPSCRGTAGDTLGYLAERPIGAWDDPIYRCEWTMGNGYKEIVFMKSRSPCQQIGGRLKPYSPWGYAHP